MSAIACGVAMMSDEDEHFGPKAPFREAAARVLTERLDALVKHEEGTREGSDPEELHDMRVASRRLRAALEAFGVCYRGKEFRAVAEQTKALTDALGGVRDSDVLLERMQAYAATLPPDELPAIGDFMDRLRAERETRRAVMLNALDEVDASEYAERFRAVVAHPHK
jgi:CHAD domain-containing protein